MAHATSENTKLSDCFVLKTSRDVSTPLSSALHFIGREEEREGGGIKKIAQNEKLDQERKFFAILRKTNYSKLYRDYIKQVTSDRQFVVACG